ncbi:aminotransferase class IV [Streptomyces sp. NPDC058662]|uniref:aminotransferase class IV n=1 Tax=Streptomyces sp. NPDC058662 TaxID=3346583 RepID=UPI00365D471D
MELDGAAADPEALRALALVNYGHFTTMRVEDGRVRGLAAHLERLRRDCRAVFDAELDLDGVRRHLGRAVAGSAAGGGAPLIVRVTVFDPALDLGRPSAPAAPRVLVTTRPAGPLAPPPMRVVSVPYERDAPAVKHTGLFGALHARRTAQRGGFDDALFLGRDELVSEGPTWNVGFVDADGTVVWPAAEVLPGVTMELLRRHHPHVVTPVTREAAHGMRAAFATNAGIGVRAVTAIDTAPFPPDDPVLAALRETYRSLPADPVRAA